MRFLTDLAAVVDRDTEAEVRHGDLLTHNTAVAALREEAVALAATLGQAGADFVPSIDFQRRLGEELKARREGRPHRQDSQELTLPAFVLPDVISEPAGPSTNLAVVDFGPPANAVHSGARARRKRRSPRPQLLALLFVVVVLAAVVLAGEQGRHNLRGHLDALSRQLSALSSATEATAPAPPAQPSAPAALPLVMTGMLGPEEEVAGLPEANPSALGHANKKPLSLSTGPRSQLSVNRADGLLLVLGPRSRLSYVGPQHLSLSGAARLTLPPTTTTISLRQAELVGRDALLMVLGDGVDSQVAVLRGEVRVEPAQAAPVILSAFQTVAISSRGPAVVAPLRDHRAFLAAVDVPAAGLGRLGSGVDDAPSYPTRHEVHAEIQGGHALLTVIEQFAAAEQPQASEYVLPLPPFSRLVQGPMVVQGTAETSDGASSGTSLVGDARLANVHRGPSPLRLQTRYLLPLAEDGQGRYLSYDLSAPEGISTTRIQLSAKLLDAGSLTSQLSGAESSADTRQLRWADTPLQRALRVHIDVAASRPRSDGTVIWASPEGPLSAGDHWQPGNDAHASAYAVLNISPIPLAASAPSRGHYVVIVDDSHSMAAQRRLARTVLDELVALLPPTAKLSVLYCRHNCSAPEPAGEPQGAFDLSAALLDTARLLAPELDEEPPPHLIVLTERGPSAGDYAVPDALKRTILSLIVLGDEAIPAQLRDLARSKDGLLQRVRHAQEAQAAAARLTRVNGTDGALRGMLTVSQNEHGAARFQHGLQNLLPGDDVWISVPGKAADGATALLQATLGAGDAPLTRSYVLGHHPPTFASSPYNALARLMREHEPPAVPTHASPWPLTALTESTTGPWESIVSHLLSQATQLGPRAAVRANRPRTLSVSQMEPLLAQVVQAEGSAQDVVRMACATGAAAQCLAAAQALHENAPESAESRAFVVSALLRNGLRDEAFSALADIIDDAAPSADMQTTYGSLLRAAGHSALGCSHLRMAWTLDPAVVRPEYAACDANLPTGPFSGESGGAATVSDRDTTAGQSADEDERADLRVSAVWQHGDAFDLVLTDMHGRSVSWLSPLIGASLGEVRHGFSVGQEQLVVSRLPRGVYQLSLVANALGDMVQEAASARVTVRLGASKQVYDVRPSARPGAQPIAYVLMP